MNLAAAHNKLRQAELLCSYLQQLPNDIARDMRKARSDADGHRLQLEAFFSAAMGAAQSSFYILTYDPQLKVFPRWKMTALDQDGRTRFHRLHKLRDDDVHYGVIPASVVSKMVPIEESYDPSHIVHHNAVLFGPRPVTEYVNPDGATARGYGLLGTVGLYIEVGGATLEAITACVWFIQQLRSLLRAAEAAVGQTLQPQTATEAGGEPLPP